MPPKTRLAAKREREASKTENLLNATRLKFSKPKKPVKPKMKQMPKQKKGEQLVDPPSESVFELKELFCHIVSFLFNDIDTIITLSQISKRHHEWINSPELWQIYGFLNRNFSLTCRNLRLEANILTAECRDKSGQYRTSSVDLDLVLRNTDGVLTPGYNFSHSSSEIELDPIDQPILRAQCCNCQGFQKKSWVNLNAVIGNQDGRLAVTDGFVVKTYFVRNFPKGFWSNKFSRKAYLEEYQDYND
eukprot:TRINITY_DN5850_c0_g1_i1.p1 TRINITY_DN5850_c0_g1~~TRINITY_DN5850_c0_g1_i1.p1  ORF type:complete len:246 (-),score=14.48 TRINITY_DN5850_c0_g1_i1:235-972(-)